MAFQKIPIRGYHASGNVTAGVELTLYNADTGAEITFSSTKHTITITRFWMSTSASIDVWMILSSVGTGKTLKYEHNRTDGTSFDVSPPHPIVAECGDGVFVKATGAGAVSAGIEGFLHIED